MKKKIKDLTLEDMPVAWDKLFSLDQALMCLFTTDEERFNKAKSTIPQDLLEKEIEF